MSRTRLTSHHPGGLEVADERLDSGNHPPPELAPREAEARVACCPTEAAAQLRVSHQLCRVGSKHCEVVPEQAGDPVLDYLYLATSRDHDRNHPVAHRLGGGHSEVLELGRSGVTVHAVAGCVPVDGRPTVEVQQPIPWRIEVEVDRVAMGQAADALEVFDVGGVVAVQAAREVQRPVPMPPVIELAKCLDHDVVPLAVATGEETTDAQYNALLRVPLRLRFRYIDRRVDYK